VQGTIIYILLIEVIRTNQFELWPKVKFSGRKSNFLAKIKPQIALTMSSIGQNRVKR